MINAVTLLAFAAWLAGLLGIIFYLASAKDKSWNAILIASSLILYPSLIGLFYNIKSWDFFNVSFRTFSLFTTVVPLLVFVLFLGRPIVNKLRGVSDVGITKKEKAIFLDGNEIKGADTNTFKAIDDAYSLDKDHVYYRTKILAGVDPKTFSKIAASQFFTDNKVVIYKGNFLQNVDAATFKLLKNSAYAIDKNKVYYFDDVVSNADPKTFDPINETSYAKDKTNVYFLDKAVDEPVDVLSFKVLDSDAGISRDKNFIYLDGRYSAGKKIIYKIKEADSLSFTILGRGYCKDKQHVFYTSQYPYALITDVDAASFVVTNFDQKSKSEARDKTHFYMEGKSIGKVK